MRAVMLDGSLRSSRCSFSSGNSAVRSSNRGRFLAASGDIAVDGVHLEQRRVLLVALGGAAGTGDVVALAQPVLAGEAHRHVRVVAARQVPVDAQEAVALVAHVEVARHGHRLVDRRRLTFDDQVLVLALRALVAAHPCPCDGADGGGCGSRRHPAAVAVCPPPCWPSRPGCAGRRCLSDCASSTTVAVVARPSPLSASPRGGRLDLGASATVVPATARWRRPGVGAGGRHRIGRARAPNRRAARRRGRASSVTTGDVRAVGVLGSIGWRWACAAGTWRHRSQRRDARGGPSSRRCGARW